MRAVAQIAQSVEQGIENPHDTFHTTALDSTPYKASLSMRGLFVLCVWSISGKVRYLLVSTPNISSLAFTHSIIKFVSTKVLAFELIINSLNRSV